MALDPTDLDDATLAFLAERHLATLTVIRPDGTPHVTPVGFTWDDERRLARVITWTTSKKARLVAGSQPTPVAVSQVDGGRWLTLEGMATVTDDADACAEGCRRYAERYREPKERPDRAVIEIAVTQILGRA